MSYPSAANEFGFGFGSLTLRGSEHRQPRLQGEMQFAPEGVNSHWQLTPPQGSEDEDDEEVDGVELELELEKGFDTAAPFFKEECAASPQHVGHWFTLDEGDPHKLRRPQFETVHD